MDEQEVINALNNCYIFCANRIAAQQQEVKNMIAKERRSFAARMRRRRREMMTDFLQMQERMVQRMLPLPPPEPQLRSPSTFPGSTHWWFDEVLEVWDDSKWKTNFRMNKSTFMNLCCILRPLLQSSLDESGRILSVLLKAGISLYNLANRCESRLVGNQFGVDESTVNVVQNEFCHVVDTVLKIKLPNAEECGSIAYEPRRKCLIPQLVKAISGMDIPIMAPGDGI